MSLVGCQVGELTKGQVYNMCNGNKGHMCIVLYLTRGSVDCRSRYAYRISLFGI